MMRKALGSLILMASLVTFAGVIVRAQTGSDADNINAYMDLLKSDLRTKKAIIIREQLTLTNTEANAFWRLYKRYEMTLDALNTAKIVLIKDFAVNSETMTDAKAKELSIRTLDLEDKRQLLRKKFYREFEKVLNGKAVAQFIQLDRRFDLLMDLQIASEVPVVK